MPSAATSVVGMNSYEYDEGLDVNESEIEILMSRGYTREQAEAVYEDRLASQRNYGNSGVSF